MNAESIGKNQVGSSLQRMRAPGGYQLPPIQVEVIIWNGIWGLSLSSQLLGRARDKDEVGQQRNGKNVFHFHLRYVPVNCGIRSSGYRIVPRPGCNQI